MLLTIIISVAALILGGIGGYLVFRYVLKGKYNEMVEAAEKALSAILQFRSRRHHMQV